MQCYVISIIYYGKSHIIDISEYMYEVMKRVRKEWHYTNIDWHEGNSIRLFPPRACWSPQINLFPEGIARGLPPRTAGSHVIITTVRGDRMAEFSVFSGFLPFFLLFHYQEAFHCCLVVACSNRINMISIQCHRVGQGLTLWMTGTCRVNFVDDWYMSG